MRAILSLLVLVGCASFAFAVDKPPTDPANVPLPQSRAPDRNHATLQLSPMYGEIRDSLAISDAKQKQLLVDLAAATDEPAAAAIVRELEALPIERILTVLRIQLRYAQQEHRSDLERELRLRMLELQATGNI
jgi:hypothetical protein